MSALVPSAATMWRVGALSGASSVLLGAFGAHALKARLGEGSPLLATWATAAQYHLVHSGAILIAAGAARQHQQLRPAGGGPATAAAFFAAGTLLFSGSLYALVLTGEKRLGAVTPIGGVLLTAGWLALLL